MDDRRRRTGDGGRGRTPVSFCQSVMPDRSSSPFAQLVYASALFRSDWVAWNALIGHPSRGESSFVPTTRPGFPLETCGNDGKTRAIRNLLNRKDLRMTK